MKQWCSNDKTRMFATVLLSILIQMTPSPTTDGKRLIDEFSKDDHLSWFIVNDGVMGGMSQSQITYTDQGTAVFSGDLSLENNGGFASTRAVLKETVSGINAVQLRVKGDGRSYSIRFRTTERFDGPSYVANFETTRDSWETITIPLADFVLQFRGYPMRDQPALLGEDIRQVAFLISDKQEGEFQLEIDFIYGIVE